MRLLKGINVRGCTLGRDNSFREKLPPMHTLKRVIARASGVVVWHGGVFFHPFMCE